MLKAPRSPQAHRLAPEARRLAPAPCHNQSRRQSASSIRGKISSKVFNVHRTPGVLRKLTPRNNRSAARGKIDALRLTAASDDLT